ncbi:hypothetical protein CEXT_795241 [Caerostris extrusa]|uniref:Uncharacterized protein n=1 Tax=Caerostris extrusa TaxID=172846 RepID=A0AAV4XV19_CAEEX|nr:hypothetical protein CEXT_795241 [Caerostris extrusa]
MAVKSRPAEEIRGRMVADKWTHFRYFHLSWLQKGPQLKGVNSSPLGHCMHYTIVQKCNNETAPLFYVRSLGKGACRGRIKEAPYHTEDDPMAS